MVEDKTNPNEKLKAKRSKRKDERSKFFTIKAQKAKCKVLSNPMESFISACSLTSMFVLGCTIQPIFIIETIKY